MTEPDALAQPVYARDGYKAFGDFTCEDVLVRGAELTAATGWGPTARVASVARAWAELARVMTAARAQRVSDLGPDEAERFARRLWVLPPGGTLL